MGILDNFENAWDADFLFESKPIPVTDAMGRETFWEDMGRMAEESEQPNLAVKLFSETCCSGCTCKE